MPKIIFARAGFFGPAFATSSNSHYIGGLVNSLLGEASVIFPIIDSSNRNAININMSWKSYPTYSLVVIYGERGWLVTESNRVNCKA